MALTGKDILDALGIDETHEADIGQPAVERTVSLLKERLLLDLRSIAKKRGSNIDALTIERWDLVSMIDGARMYEVRNGYSTMGGELGTAICTGLKEVYVSLERLLSDAVEA